MQRIKITKATGEITYSNAPSEMLERKAQQLRAGLGAGAIVEIVEFDNTPHCPDCGQAMTIEHDGNRYCEYCEG